jgi:phage gp29-like protein
VWEKVDYDVSEIIVWSWRPEAGNPEGLGAFRQAHKHWYMKQVLEEFAAIRIERQAMGVPIAIGPPEGYTTTEQELVLAQLQNLRTAHDAGMVIPDGWKVEMLQLGAADVPFENHIERQHMSILETCLVQFVGLGHSGERGSFGLSRDSSNLFLMSLEAIADWICDCVNEYMIPQLARYNGVQGQLPKMAHGKVGVRDLDKFTRAIANLYKTAQGVQLPPEVDEYMREVIGLPPKRPEDEVEPDKALSEDEPIADRSAEDMTAPGAAR